LDTKLRNQTDDRRCGFQSHGSILKTLCACQFTEFLLLMAADDSAAACTEVLGNIYTDAACRYFRFTRLELQFEQTIRIERLEFGGFDFVLLSSQESLVIRIALGSIDKRFL